MYRALLSTLRVAEPVSRLIAPAVRSSAVITTRAAATVARPLPPKLPASPRTHVEKISMSSDGRIDIQGDGLCLQAHGQFDSSQLHVSGTRTSINLGKGYGAINVQYQTPFFLTVNGKTIRFENPNQTVVKEMVTVTDTEIIRQTTSRSSRGIGLAAVLGVTALGLGGYVFFKCKPSDNKFVRKDEGIENNNTP